MLVFAVILHTVWASELMMAKIWKQNNHCEVEPDTLKIHHSEILHKKVICKHECQTSVPH